MPWYCRYEGEELGPLTPLQLKDLAERGIIDDRWQVRRDGDSVWHPATRVRGLPLRPRVDSVDPLSLLDSAGQPVPSAPAAVSPEGPTASPRLPTTETKKQAAPRADGQRGAPPASPPLVPAALRDLPDLPPLPDRSSLPPLDSIAWAFEPPAAASPLSPSEPIFEPARSGTSRKSSPPPLPRRSGPPPLPTRAGAVPDGAIPDTAIPDTAIPGKAIPGKAPPGSRRPADRVARPMSLTILGFVVLSVGFAAMLLPTLLLNGDYQALAAEHGIPAWLTVTWGMATAVTLSACGFGLLAGTTAAARWMFEGLLVTQFFLGLLVLSPLPAVASGLVISVAMVVLHRRAAREYFASLRSPRDQHWRTAGGVGLVGVNVAVAVIAAVLIYRGPGERTGGNNTVAIRRPPAAAGAVGVSTDGPPTNSPMPGDAAGPFRYPRRNGVGVDGGPPASVQASQQPTPIGSDDRLYWETADSGGNLVGVEIVEGTAGRRVASVRPIFRTDNDNFETTGPASGERAGRVRTLKAKPGYAVGGMKAAAGKANDGFCLTFMKIDGERLDPRDAYDSEWVGDGFEAKESLDGDGRPVSGVFARVDVIRSVRGLGLVFEGDPSPRVPDGRKQWQFAAKKDHPIYGWNAESAPAGENKTRIVGGGEGDADHAFHLADQGYLVGFQFGLDDRFGREVITAVRPIAKVGSERIYGPWHGETRGRVVEIRGDGDDMVTALRVYGRETADGVRVTFSRAGSDRLPDTANNYESEPIGYLDERYVVSLTGYGRTITGMAGRVRNGRNTGLGLCLGPPADGHLVTSQGLKPSYDHQLSPLGPHAETFLRVPGSSRRFGGHDRKGDTQTEVSSTALTGFEFVVQNVGDVEVISSLRPLFDQTSGGIEEWNVSAAGRSVQIRARYGYTVSGARLYGTIALEGIRLTFSRINGEGCDPADSYDGPMVGRTDERNFAHFNSRGRQIRAVGIWSYGAQGTGVVFTAAGSEGSTASMQGKSKPFEEAAPAGGLLVGFEVGLAKKDDRSSRVVSLRPIFRTGEIESKGERHGAEHEDEVVVLKVPDGHAVSAIRSHGSSRIEGIALLSALQEGGRESTRREEASRMVGDSSGSNRFYSDRGKLLRAFRAVETDSGIEDLNVSFENSSVGPSLSRAIRLPPSQPPARMAVPTATVRPPFGRPAIPGTASAPKVRYPNPRQTTSFREPVPPGAWLVGFDVTLSSADADAVVTSVRPIFRRGDVETRGERRGVEGARSVEVKARTGFAVGGMAANGGVARDGFSLFTMKIVDDRLDTVLAHVQPVGRMPTHDADRIGRGVPVRGVFGRTDETGALVGMGLEFAPVEIAAPDPWSGGPEVAPLDLENGMTRMAGGAGSGTSAGSTEGPVTGVEFGLIEWFGRDVIGAVYATGEKNVFGGPNQRWVGSPGTELEFAL